MKWGAISAVVIILYSAMMDVLGLKSGVLAQIVGYVSIVILPIGMFLGLREVKVKTGKKISFLKALVIGLSISLLTATILTLYRYVTLTYFAELLNIESMEERLRQSLESQNVSEDKIAAKIKELNEKYPSGFAFINTYKWYTILGAAYSTVIYFILKINPKKNE